MHRRKVYEETQGYIVTMETEIGKIELQAKGCKRLPETTRR